MKKIKKLLSAILTVVLLFTGIPMTELNFADIKAEAATTNLDKLFGEFVFKTNTDDSGKEISATIIYYKGAEKDIVIPEKIGPLPVTRIEEQAFSPIGAYDEELDIQYLNSKLRETESIYIPDTVEYIGFRAFGDCENLKEVKLSENLKVIEQSAFSDCTSLKELEFGNKLEFIGKYFVSDTQIKEIVFPGGAGVELEVDSYAFQGSAAETVIFESDYIKVNNYAFYYYTKQVLKELVFEGEVTCWGKSAFGANNSSKYYFPDKVIFKDSFDDKAYENLAGYYEKTYIDDWNNTGWTVFFNNDEANWFTEGNYKYFLKNNKAVIADYEDNGEAIVAIPTTLGGKAVSEIGYAAFENADGIREIDVPACVEKIGPHAFERCDNLKKITFASDNIRFGTASFLKCSMLQNVILPDSATEIPDRMFEECFALTSVIAKGVKIIGDSSFKQCSSLINVQLSPDLQTVKAYGFYGCAGLESIGVTGEKITKIGEYAFALTAIKSFVFSDKIISVPNNCFSRSEISQLYIPEGVENIEASAFGSCKSLEKIILPDSVQTVGDYAFSSCSTASEFKFSKNLKSIGECAFKNCARFTGTLTLDKNIEFIGSYAFEDTSFDSLYYNVVGFEIIDEHGWKNDILALHNTNFKNIVIGNDVEILSRRIFESQSEITSLTIPESVRIIDRRAFFDCYRLSTLIIKDGVEEILDNAFTGCNSLTEFTIPKTVKKFAGDALPGRITTCYFNAENCDFSNLEHIKGRYYGVSPFATKKIENVVIGNTVKRIPDFFLHDYIFEKELVIPESVLEIGKYAFAHTMYEKVTFPSKLVSIGYGAFSNSRINNQGRFLPDSLRMIEGSAFSSCGGLVEIDIPDSVVYMEESVFSGCDYLKKVRMSSNVKYLMQAAFFSCDSLVEFEWDADVKLIGNQTFELCTSLVDFDFKGVELLHPNSFVNSGVKTVILGEDKNEEANGLVSVEEQSFKNCTDLESVSVGGNVATIKSEAFADCDSLETAVISDSVVNIASDAFSGCDTLTICCMEDSYAHEYALKNNIPVSTFVIAPIPNQVYTGKKIEPDIDVTMTGRELAENTDFSIKYADNINIGTAKVTVKGKGIYKALASLANFTIITKNISSATVVKITDQNYTGSPITPDFTVTDGGNILKAGTDYTVTYKNNTQVGTATVTIKGIGNYSGTTSTTFNITEQTFFQRLKNALIAFFAIIKAWFVSIFG